MRTINHAPSRPVFYLKRAAFGLAFVFFIAVLAVSVLDQVPRPVSAAEPVSQCNGVGGGGGEGYACFVTIDNYLTVNADGGVVPAAPSTLTVRVCNGAAGPFLATSPPLTKGPLPAALCGVPVTTFPEGPITTIDQCNGSVGGGGAVLICEVIVNNHFTTVAPVTLTAVTVFQCEASATTGDIVDCDPPSNIGSGAVTTVVQCNGSANGGGSAVRCTVNGATTVIPMTILQCNGSGAGGTLVDCTTTLNNLDETIVGTPTPTASPTATVVASPTPTVAASPTVVATVVPTATATASPTALATVSPTVAATVTTLATLTPTATVVPTVTGSATVNATPLATVAPDLSQALNRPAATATLGAANRAGESSVAGPAAPLLQAPGATLQTPRPPATGNAGLVESDGGSFSVAAWLFGAAAIGLAFMGRRLGSRSSRR